jgi:hypothetical protein
MRSIICLVIAISLQIVFGSCKAQSTLIGNTLVVSTPMTATPFLGKSISYSPSVYIYFSTDGSKYVTATAVTGDQNKSIGIVIPPGANTGSIITDGKNRTTVTISGPINMLYIDSLTQAPGDFLNLTKASLSLDMSWTVNVNGRYCTVLDKRVVLDEFGVSSEAGTPACQVYSGHPFLKTGMRRFFSKIA